MTTWLRLALLLLALAPFARPAPAAPPDRLYTAQAIVTGTGETNRQPGFRDCLDRVLLRVSGDPRVLTAPPLAALRAEAGHYVRDFSYRDRLAGKPVHDEQGTYDRPHDLTCHYDPAVIDRLLADLGSRPWRAPRPVLAVSLTVTREGKTVRLSGTGARDADMRSAFTDAATAMAMRVAFPDAATLSGSLPLVGTLVWSDADLGWVADWQLTHAGQTRHWQIRGISYDQAFRTALTGAAQILSGNGAP